MSAAANVPSPSVPATALPAATAGAAAAASDGITEEPVAPVPEPAVLTPSGITPQAVPADTRAAAATAQPRWRFIAAGYVLVALGASAFPFVPALKSPLLARLSLIGLIAVLAAGAAAVVWGFVADAIRRR